MEPDNDDACLLCEREEHDYGCPSCNAQNGLCRACEDALVSLAAYYEQAGATYHDRQS